MRVTITVQDDEGNVDTFESAVEPIDALGFGKVGGADVSETIQRTADRAKAAHGYRPGNSFTKVHIDCPDLSHLINQRERRGFTAGL